MDDLAWERLSVEGRRSFEGFDVLTERVRLPDGAKTEFDYVTKAESVLVVPVRPGGEIVVVEEWRQAIGGTRLSLPGGSLEGDEDPVSGAHRELEEETGYRAGSVDHLTTAEPAVSFSDAIHHFVVAEGCSPTGSRDLDDDESIRVETMSLDALLRRIEDGQIRDGASVLGVLYYELFGAHSNGKRE